MYDGNASCVELLPAALVARYSDCGDVARDGILPDAILPAFENWEAHRVVLHRGTGIRRSG